MANVYELDFTGIQSSNFIGEGVHTVRISEAEFKKASTGSDQLQLTFEASDGAIRSAWYSLVPQALWKLKGVLETLGIPCDGKIKLNTAVFKNKVCTITVEPDPNDDTRLIISKVSKASQANNNVAYASSPATAPQAPVMAPPVTNPVEQATQPAAPVAPVQQAAQPVQANLPPWMTQNAPAQPANAPQGNLPPWMK
jgi:hypothetical protein